jgi:hypothetical protein
MTSLGGDSVERHADGKLRRWRFRYTRPNASQLAPGKRRNRLSFGQCPKPVSLAEAVADSDWVEFIQDRSLRSPTVIAHVADEPWEPLAEGEILAFQRHDRRQTVGGWPWRMDGEERAESHESDGREGSPRDCVGRLKSQPFSPTLFRALFGIFFDPLTSFRAEKFACA